MNKKKIVLISALFPPVNSARTNRTAELAKELARQGHDVTVYAALGKHDYSSFEKKNKLKVRSLGKMFFYPNNSDGKIKRRSIFKRIINRVLLILFRRTLEYPNMELSVKVARIIKKEKNIDSLITIAPPFPIHWGAAYAKKYFKSNNIKIWIADCGDPYMGNKFFKYPFYFKYVEKWFCRKTDYITIPIKEAKEGYYKEFHDKIKVIPQGFNFDEVEIPLMQKNNDVITFIYAGVFYEGIRDPRPFLDYLSDLDKDFKFLIYTKTKDIINEYKTKLGSKLEINDYIPRLELLKIMSQADFLINFENQTDIQSPSKLIDYALSKRPILSISPYNLDHMKIEQFLNGDYSNKLVIDDIEQYNIRNVASSFLKLIDSFSVKY